MILPDKIVELAEDIKNAGGTLYVVGGAVRDWLMGAEPTDFDLLIVGLDAAKGLEILGQPTQVIGNAPVFIWKGFEIAFARREISVGNGKHAFSFVADRHVTLVEDLHRRDFTINAMAYDVLKGELYDPFNGRQHVLNRVLHPVSNAFAESPERVLRGASFAARLNFKPSPALINIAKEMWDDFNTIPAEQIWRHWEKMCKLAIKPSMWLNFMLITRWLYHFPPLWNMVGVVQDKVYHPEGDLITHIAQVMDMAAQAANMLEVDRVWAITTAILHDVGKAITTIEVGGVVRSFGHAEAGVNIARTFLEQISAPHKFTERVLEGVRLHMRHIDVNNRRSIRRLLSSMQHITLSELACIVMADQSGRHPFGQPTLEMPKTMQFVIDNAAEMRLDNGFEPIIKGRHLIDLGMQPSKEFGLILNAAKEAQIEGLFDNLNDGLIWLREFLK